jgi:hypothetical protein
LGEKQYKTLPSPRMMEITPASTSDITHAKEMLRQAQNIEIFADKIYLDASWHEELKTRGVTIITPVKLKKGQELLSSADKLLSSAVSRARQAIESFNNWIHQKQISNQHLRFGLTMDLFRLPFRGLRLWFGLTGDWYNIL